MQVKNQPEEYATKKDLKQTEHVLRGEISGVKENAKQYRDQILTRLDEVMGELGAMREENTIGAYQTSEIRRSVDNHEKRIQKLETVKL